MGLFHVLAGALALVTALTLVRPLIRGRGGAPARSEGAARLYRDQLGEIDRDLARGTINPGEAEGARAEVSRRLLGATTEAVAAARLAPAPRRHSAMTAGIALIGAPALALAVYLPLGAPDLPDQPISSRPAAAIAARPSQAEAEAAIAAGPIAPAPAGTEEYAGLIAQLEGIVAQRPDDIEGNRLLADGYTRLGRPAKAWPVYAALIRLLGDAAEPELFGAQIDAMVQAADGYVSPEAALVLGVALARDPSMPAARYYSGLLHAQQGRLAEAVAVWERLRADTPADAPLVGFLGQMLAEATAALAGPPGPGAAEIEAAAGMAPEDRQAMIEGMVARLEDRLATEGGAVEEWLRLINAYAQLGRPEEARRVYRLGAAALGTGSEAGFLREQALILGVIAE